MPHQDIVFITTYLEMQRAILVKVLGDLGVQLAVGAHDI
jgi:hypothetical protein